MNVIQTFGNALARDLFHDRQSKATRLFPTKLRRPARRKILYLHDAAIIEDLRSPPGNRLERLVGKRRGFHSIRIDDHWRMVFQWKGGHAYDVEIIDYH